MIPDEWLDDEERGRLEDAASDAWVDPAGEVIRERAR